MFNILLSLLEVQWGYKKRETRGQINEFSLDDIARVSNNAYRLLEETALAINEGFVHEIDC